MARARHESLDSRHELSPARLRLGPREIATIVACWAFLALLAAAGRLLDPRIPDLRPEVSSALVRLSVFEYALWAALSIPIVWIAGRFDPTAGRRWPRIIALVVLGIAIAIGMDLVLRSARAYLLPIPRRFRRAGPFDAILAFEFLPDFMVYLAVLGAGLTRAYIIRYRDRLEATRALQAEADRLNVQLTDARLSALRSQLNPHFLFNTLNAVSALLSRDPSGARRMLARLSDLLRHALEETDPEIPIEREVELAERYLDIMQARFQGTLDVAIEVDPRAAHAFVPNLILQPLIENAFKHGAPAEGPSRVQIRATVDGSALVLAVSDNGPGPTAGAEQRVGLGNTRQRLHELYGAAGTLELVPGAPAGAVARVRLPLHTTPLRASHG